MSTAGQVLARIEKDLRDMWSAPPSPGELPKSRACTTNLVVVVSGAAKADESVAMVDDVTQSVPARAIVVVLDPTAEGERLEGDATAVCSPGEGGAVCSERVLLRASGAICARVASAVDALLVPELPTTLVWLGRAHVDDPVWRSLAASAGRIVLDSDPTSIASLVQVARWSHAVPGRACVSDLAWTRIAVWQEMCARFFDEPRLHETALHVTKLALRQASAPGARLGSEGALLLGWLATRLGWTPAHLAGALRLRRPDGGIVAVELRGAPGPKEAAPCALAGVSIEAEHAGVAIRATLERDLASCERDEGEPEGPEADVLSSRVEIVSEGGTKSFEQRVRLRANRGARLLERTLHRPSRDDALVESAAFIDEILVDDLLVG